MMSIPVPISGNRPMNIYRTGRYFYLRFLRIRGTPHSIALGAAIGVFIGITPTVPFHSMIIFVLAILTRSSFISGLITSWLVSNPLTCLPLYYLAITFGNLVTPYHLDWERVKSIGDLFLSGATPSARLELLGTLGGEALSVMLIGGFLLALPWGVGSYFLFHRLIVKYRRKRHLKQVLH